MAVSPILLKRRLGGAPVAVPAGSAALAGEAWFNVPGFTGNGPNSLWIDNGTNVIPLVDNQRQVELTGAQTITGPKTVSGTGVIALAGVANMTFGDGTAGDSLIKGAGNALVWSAAAAATVVVSAPITGNGTGGSPVGITAGTAAAIGAVNVPAGSALNIAAGAIGMTVASAANVTTGTDNVFPISSLRLRGEMGAAASTLTTTNKTVVPAINELQTSLASVLGAVIFTGTYNVATNTVTPSKLIGAGALPVAAPANDGWYVICTVAGTGTGNAPAVPIAVNDWLVSDGAAWVHLALAQSTVAASTVTVAPAVNGQANVQAALQSIEAQVVAGPTLFVDAGNFTGNLLTAGTQLVLTLVDGGTF